jgi:hypothetical protein
LNRKSIIAIIITFLAGLFAGNGFCKLTQYLKAKKIADELLEETAESIYPCELVVVTHYNQEEEFTITDFSQYDEKKRVSIIINKVESHSNGGTKLDDDIIMYPRAVVYKIGETWLWKEL